VDTRKHSQRQIIGAIAKYLNAIDSVIFAYIFGSFARGEDFSDIDVAIYLRDNFDKSPLEIEFEMEDRIEELTGHPVDVRILGRAPISFVFQVIKDGLLIKDDNPDTRSDFEGLIFKKNSECARFRNEYLREIADAPI